MKDTGRGTQVFLTLGTVLISLFDHQHAVKATEKWAIKSEWLTDRRAISLLCGSTDAVSIPQKDRMHSNIGENLSSRRTKKGRRVRGEMEICFMLMGAVHSNASGAARIGRGGPVHGWDFAANFSSVRASNGQFLLLLPA